MSQIREMFAQRAAAAQQTEVTATETVTVADLQAGDIITALGNQTFPFPFTLSNVKLMPTRKVAVLRAEHGWFTMTPVKLAESVVRAC